MSATPTEPFEVEDLDAAGVLAYVANLEAESRRLEAAKLAAAAHWADLHPATHDTGVATHGGPALDVLDGEESLGGDGTPAVAAFTPEPFALAMGLSPASGAKYLADALDLRHRLPILHARVNAGLVPAWQARRVAQHTHRLPLAGARWVDEQLATRTDHACGPVIVDRLIAQITAELDPETQREREADAEDHWDVSTEHPSPGDPDGDTATSHLHAAGDRLVLAEFQELVDRIAHQLLLDGDTSPLGVRKIKAIRIITRAAHGRPTPDLADGVVPATTGRVVAYVHLDLDDLDLGPDDATSYAGTTCTFGGVEKAGAASLAKIRSWVGHHHVVVRPVLNLHRGDAVDVHDPPDWMRELVILRDQHCIFPRCTRDARACDLDHTTPYRPMKDGGPPGQTRAENLACLCRRHHRAKTAGTWRYTREPDGSYLWHGPLSTTWIVTTRGTRRA